MNPANAAILTGVIVTLGRWSEGKKIDIRVVVGVTLLALFLSIMSQTQNKMATGFSLLIVIAALLKYTIPISKRLGI